MTKNGFCPGIQMRVNVNHEKANLAHETNYSENHQKFENPGKKISKMTTKGSSWMDSQKLKTCEVCYMGMMEIKQDDADKRKGRNASVVNCVEGIKKEEGKIKMEEVKFKTEEKIESEEEKIEIKGKNEIEEIQMEEKIEKQKAKMMLRK